jgi:ubiquinone/menaquinone biosynthesis C-methylase UbiE
MEKIINEKQYNNFAEGYSENIQQLNSVSRESFFGVVGSELKDKSVLDVACGDGTDGKIYKDMGATYAGVDISEENIRVAKTLDNQSEFLVGRAEELAFTNESFDLVVSKYAIQSFLDIEKFYKEVHRVLKPGGKFIFLGTHPTRQFIEKNKVSKDYFKSEIVESTIFNGKIKLEEPSHTFNEYLSAQFLKDFDLRSFVEKEEFPGADRIGEDNYPCFFIVESVKR